MGYFSHVLAQFTGKRVLVVGDLCLDEYIVGKASRLSREAPIPVLEYSQRFTLPGAAANPARNVVALGGEVLIAGVTGDDEAGHTLIGQLAGLGVNVRGIIVDPGRDTTLKTRVVAEVGLLFPQQLARVDRQAREPIRPAARNALAEYVAAVMDEVDAVLVSDYRAGVVGQRLVEVLAERGQATDKVLTVDSQGNLYQFKRFTVVKCNREEAEALLRQKLRSDRNFQRQGCRLLNRLMAQALVITRGSEGMSLVEADGSHYHISAANRSEVYDVTGAGDTVIATLTLALAAGASTYDATFLSNIAAGLVVRKLGNATTTQQELEEAARAAMLPA